MTLDEINRFCRNLPGCDVRYPFDSNPGLRAWCLNKKMFAWTLTGKQPTMVQLKANPDLVPDLIANYDFIYPGYHMNKRHWITVDASRCDSVMLKKLLEDAHSLVMNSLPEAARIGLSND